MEVVVAAGIILLLASILAPVTFAVRERAVDVMCRSHLRQLGLAFSLYAERYGGMLPHEDDGDTLPPFGCGWVRTVGALVGDARLLACPKAEPDPEARSYKMNSLLEQEEVWFYPVWRSGQPAAMPLLFDGRVDNPGLRRLPKGTWSAASTRHRGATNLLFLDGHVESFSPGPLREGWPGPGPFRWRP